MSNRTALQSLPLEIQEFIIDCLSHDKPSLLAASSVCNAWRMGCYRHLFASLKLDPKSVGPLARLLKSPLTRSVVPSRVRQLCLGSQNGWTSWDASQTEALRSILVHLSKAGRVICLVLTYIHWPSIDIEVRSSLFSGFKTVRSLQLLRSSFGTPTELGDFISVYTQVERIWLQNVSCLSPCTFPPPSKPPAGRYSLQLSTSIDTRPRTGLRWSHRAGSPPTSPEDLRLLGHIFVAYWGNFNKMLQLLGPSLHSLELMSPSQNTVSENAPYAIDLSHSTSLEHLTLGFPTRVLAVMPWIPRILHRLEANTLKGLQITFSASRQFFLDLPFLGCLATILQQSQYQNLEYIHFLAFDALADEELKKVIIKHVSESLSSWHQQGKLKFTFLL